MTTNETSRQYVPLTCHGHSRPVTHLSFSGIVGDNREEYYLISACKDNNPMLRDGMTGDWIGTFFGHKGAVYQARLSPDASLAATASADFTARVWDTHTGETLYTLQHNHIVRAVAFPPNNGQLLATGGMEKKLRIFDLSSVAPIINGAPTNGDSSDPTIISADKGFEIGPDVHKGAIKAIIWTHDPNILVTAADDKIIRWWDLQNRVVIQELPVKGDIGSCEFNMLSTGADSTDIGSGMPVLAIAAGRTVYFYGGADARHLLKSVELPYDVASVAIHPKQRKFVTGGIKDTWAKVYNYDTEQELDVHKGHHGPIWSISFSPDGKLYATGSEDGTIKMWKNCAGPFGLWRAEKETLVPLNLAKRTSAVPATGDADQGGVCGSFGTSIVASAWRLRDGMGWAVRERQAQGRQDIDGTVNARIVRDTVAVGGWEVFSGGMAICHDWDKHIDPVAPSALALGHCLPRIESADEDDKDHGLTMRPERAALIRLKAHTVISYPGWRGDNLVTNETFPFGMQWMYPCGGMGTSRNRTTWPIGGGALAVQPGWFQGHSKGFFYVNMGFGTDGPDNGPKNFTNVMVPIFEFTGPSNGPYPGTFCLPQIPLPQNASVKAGDLATIQVVMSAQHGASLFNCVDIIFAEPENVAEVNKSNCFNSSEIGFNNVFTSQISAADLSITISMAVLTPILLLSMWGLS
ncbi:hypothetical protein V494_01777 [Pseudogymnoascus sp. VKM F-4513 (FW-928)]|nr:hypothetical protein V494_01777 [Pseudogymnoascus sp. VKM F-4513 (FW-928)]